MLEAFAPKYFSTLVALWLIGIDIIAVAVGVRQLVFVLWGI